MKNIKEIMNTRSFTHGSIFAMTLLFLAACGNKAKSETDSFPTDFNSLSDTAKVAYVMQHSTPDSVARFVCDAVLGKVKEVRIDTLAIAASYAYEHYNDSDLVVFSKEFDSYAANLPLEQKMKIYSLAGTLDPQGLGYELGLEYVSHIREKHMTVEDIKEELAAFKKACADDSVTYIRFMKGFKTVLRIDHGKDLPEAVYSTFINEND